MIPTRPRPVTPSKKVKGEGKRGKKTPTAGKKKTSSASQALTQRNSKEHHCDTLFPNTSRVL
jgi:hypothetical protein